jgi:4-hydroxy-L-threonine phosphate dehydrogenase PdxA
LLTLALVPGLHSAAFAQTGAASITGLLTDQSGAAAAGATVIATNQATNVAYTAVSNEAGNYTITSVPVGTYVVKAELSGFKTVTTRPITVEAKQIARLDFKMEVGALEDTVEVTAAAPARSFRRARSSPCRSTGAMPTNWRSSCPGQ